MIWIDDISKEPEEEMKIEQKEKNDLIFPENKLINPEKTETPENPKNANEEPNNAKNEPKILTTEKPEETPKPENETISNKIEEEKESEDETEEIQLSIPAEWIFVLLFAMEIQLGFKDEGSGSELLNIDFFRDKRLFQKFFRQKSKYQFEPESKENRKDEKEISSESGQAKKNKFKLENDINHEKGNIFDIFSKETHLIINQFTKFVRKFAEKGVKGHHLKISDDKFNLLEFLNNFAKEGELNKEIVSGLNKFQMLSQNIQKSEMNSNEGFFGKKKKFGRKFYKRRKYK